MPEQRTTSEPAPPRTDRPLRQILVFLCSTYAIAVAIALALPHAGITPLASIAAPALGFAIALAVAVPRVQRRAVLATVGFHPRRGRGLLIAVVVPVLIGALSFGVAAAFGVVRFPGLGAVSVSGGLNILVGLVHLYVCLPRRRDRLAGVSAVSPGRGHFRAEGRHPHRRLPCRLPSAVTAAHHHLSERGSTLDRGADGNDHAHPGRRLVRLAATVVREYLAGLSVPQRLQQRDGEPRWSCDCWLRGDDGLRDHRDRGSDHGHRGTGRGLPVDPQRSRFRQGPAKSSASDHEPSVEQDAGNNDQPGSPALSPTAASARHLLRPGICDLLGHMAAADTWVTPHPDPSKTAPRRRVAQTWCLRLARTAVDPSPARQPSGDQGFDLVELITVRLELDVKVVAVLQVHPEAVRGAECPGQPQSGVRADRPLSMHDLVDPPRWYVDRLRQPVLAYSKRARNSSSRTSPG